MGPIVLNLLFLVLSCGGEDEGGEREERLQLLKRNFSRRKREIADAIIILVEDVIQAEEESLYELPGSDASQNTSNSQFQDISQRIKEEVSIEVLLENDFGRNKRDLLVKAKQVELFEQGSVKEDTSKKEDKFVVHKPTSIREEEEDNKYIYIAIKGMADKDLSRKKRMFSPGRRTNFGRNRRDIFTTVREQTFGQEHVQVKAESSGQIKGTTEKKSKLKAKAHDALGFAKDQSRTQVIEAPAEKDLLRKKPMFSPGRKTNFGMKRRDIFDKEEVWQPKGQINEENSRQESRNIPHMVKREELSTLKTDSLPDRHEKISPHRFSPFRGIFLFPFNTGFADFGRQLIISPTTTCPLTTTSPLSSPTPQEVSPVHIMECSGTSSSSCYNRLCTVECSGGNKVELDCTNNSLVVKTKIASDKIIISMHCGET